MLLKLLFVFIIFSSLVYLLYHNFVINTPICRINDRIFVFLDSNILLNKEELKDLHLRFLLKISKWLETNQSYGLYKDLNLSVDKYLPTNWYFTNKPQNKPKGPNNLVFYYGKDMDLSNDLGNNVKITITDLRDTGLIHELLHCFCEKLGNKDEEHNIFKDLWQIERKI